MSNVPFFSIIVPVYNVEHYLGECIDSVISQTYEDYEIILIDDGSTDNSGSICDLYKKDLIIRLKSFIKKMEACRKLEIQEFFMHREFILFFWIAMIIFWIKMP